MKYILIAVAFTVGAAGCMDSFGGFNLGGGRFLGSQQQEVDDDSPLMNPEQATEQAPDEFKVKLVTTKGDIVLQINREWSPNGADRFYNMVKIGYFDEIAIFRAVEGFMFQFGIHGNTEISKQWRKSTIKDDEAFEGVSNQKGFITFANTGAPNSRGVQMFINLGDNGRLDRMGFTPFGQVAEGMDVVEQINTEYGENKRGEQGKLQRKGNDYIKGVCPNLDYIKSASLMEEE